MRYLANHLSTRNPAIESQAIDRVVSGMVSWFHYADLLQHRIGQKNAVTVVKYIMKGTIEERVLAITEQKKKLAGATLGQLFN